MTARLTTEKFDTTFAKPDKLWGAPAIARALGVSEDTVRRWAADPDVPIYAPRRGTYFAFRSEIQTWLRRKPGA